MKIRSGCWMDGELVLSGMPADFILSARNVFVLEEIEYQQLQASHNILNSLAEDWKTKRELHHEDKKDTKEKIL